jgi:hypothetical protein
VDHRVLASTPLGMLYMWFHSVPSHLSQINPVQLCVPTLAEYTLHHSHRRCLGPSRDHNPVRSQPYLTCKLSGLVCQPHSLSMPSILEPFREGSAPVSSFLASLVLHRSQGPEVWWDHRVLARDTHSCGVAPLIAFTRTVVYCRITSHLCPYAVFVFLCQSTGSVVPEVQKQVHVPSAMAPANKPTSKHAPAAGQLPLAIADASYRKHCVI